ncbi:MAG TPA: glycosyl transferase [Xanthobacteraceae bacterium]|nr:glycosyl transferase [Xanthobacteraceae bacterium]
MQTVLLAWELGAGFGHIATLRQVAARLSAHGMRCVAAVKDVGGAAELARDGIALLQAPVWKPARSSATLGDRIGDAGLADPQALRQLLAAWCRIIDEIKPDLVVCDYAPAASLVARGRIPLALIGNGFTLPPAEMPAFPLLHHICPPVWQERFLLDTANSVLADLHLQPLQRLPQLFSGDVIWVHTFPLLDHYARWRARPAQGPAIDRLPKPCQGDGSQILIYLSSWGGGRQPFLANLRRFATRIRLFAPALPAAERESYANWGVRLEDKPFNVAEDFASARLVIHLGSDGTASACVLAGVPQLACAIDVEKELNGKALTRAGIGKFLPLYKPSVTLTEDVVAGLVADRALARTAREVGEGHRAEFGDADPSAEFEAECLKLLT